MDYAYYTQDQLLPFVGKLLDFKVWDSEKQGVLTADYNNDGEVVKLWLPFCGLVNATTVELNLPKS